MRKSKQEEDAPHPERWLVSYADFMTLMFALFVVLFASSYHDQKTVERVSRAVKSGFQQMGSFSASKSAPDNPSTDVPNIGPEWRPIGDSGGEVSRVPGNSGIDEIELHARLTRTLGQEIARNEVEMRSTPEGFVISLHELGFFKSGEARLLPGAEGKIKRIAGVLMQYGLDMRVEGHTDDLPINNASFSSNWDLSTARALAVGKMLLNESGFDPKHMSVAGYAEYHPAANNSTPEGRRMNRRVDIVVLSVTSTPKSSSH